MLCRVNHKMASKRPGDPLDDKTPGKVSRYENLLGNTTSAAGLPPLPPPEWNKLNKESKFQLIESLYNVINKRNIELFVDIESKYFEKCKEMAKEITEATDSTFNSKRVEIHVPEGDKGGVFFMDLGKGLRQNIIEKMNEFFKKKAIRDITVSAGLPSHMKTYEENYRSLAIEMIQGNTLEDDVDMNDPMRIYYEKFKGILGQASTKLKSEILPQDIIDYLCIPLINLSENCGERFSKQRDKKNAFQKADGYFLVKALRKPPQLDEFDSSDQTTKTALQYTMKWLYNFVHEKEIIQLNPWSKFQVKIGDTENWKTAANFGVLLEIAAPGNTTPTVVDTTALNDSEDSGYSLPPINAGNDASGDTTVFEGNRPAVRSGTDSGVYSPTVLDMTIPKDLNVLSTQAQTAAAIATFSDRGPGEVFDTTTSGFQTNDAFPRDDASPKTPVFLTVDDLFNEISLDSAFPPLVSDDEFDSDIPL